MFPSLVPYLSNVIFYLFQGFEFLFRFNCTQSSEFRIQLRVAYYHLPCFFFLQKKTNFLIAHAMEF